MPVTVVFTCEICGARPDAETQVALERQLLDLRHGEYVDAEPGRWLTWHGRGMSGRNGTRAAPTAARLKALVREHYGTLRVAPVGDRTSPVGRPARPTERARSFARCARPSERRADDGFTERPAARGRQSA